MKIAIDVAQTCSERAGCAWYADTLAHTLANYLSPSDIILYHHFGSWINQDTKDGTYIQNCQSPIASLRYEKRCLSGKTLNLVIFHYQELQTSSIPTLLRALKFPKFPSFILCTIMLS